MNLRAFDMKSDRLIPTKALPLVAAQTPAATRLSEQDLDRVTGGYIGETEKNLKGIIAI
jgi:hypothetical protein